MTRLCCSMTLLGLLAITSAQMQLPNLEWVGAGYDILRGNPRPTGVNSIDEGWRFSIFDFDYNKNETRQVGGIDYSVPRGYEVKSIPVCQAQYTTSDIMTAENYQEQLRSSASMEAKGWGASFKASANYKEVEQRFENNNEMVIENTAMCQIFRVSVTDNDRPTLTSNFRNAVAALPLRYAETPYEKFIRDFGTHYSQHVYLGAISGVKISVTKSSIQEMSEKGFDVKAEASYTGVAFSVSGEASVDYGENATSEFKSSVSKTEIYSIGGEFINQGANASHSIDEWKEAARKDPYPLTFELHDISSIFHKGAFPDDKFIEAKRDNLIYALNFYCDNLESIGAVRECANYKRMGVESVGTIGEVSPGALLWDDENQWTEYGNPPLSKIDLRFDGEKLVGLKPTYALGAGRTRQAIGVDLAFKGVNGMEGVWSWEEANGVCKSAEGQNGHEKEQSAHLATIQNTWMWNVASTEIERKAVPAPLVTKEKCESDRPNDKIRRMTIQCGASQLINIHEAVYGKPGVKRGGDLKPCHVKVANGCSSPNSEGAVKAMCEGKNSCSFEVNNENLGGNIMCAEKNLKYFRVRYTCETPFWLGGSQDVKGNFNWTSGQPVSGSAFQKWLPGEPAIDLEESNQKCIASWPYQGSYKWLAADCDKKYRPLCEVPFKTESVSLIDGEHLTHARACSFQENNATFIGSVEFTTSKGKTYNLKNTNEVFDECKSFEFTSRGGLLFMSGTYRPTVASNLAPGAAIESISFHQYDEEKLEEPNLTDFVDVTTTEYQKYLNSLEGGLSTEMIIIVACSSAVGLLIIVALTVCCVRKRKHKKAEKAAKEKRWFGIV